MKSLSQISVACQTLSKILKHFIFLLKNLGASLRGGRKRSGGNVESLSIPPQSRVFIQMLGDVVYTGILEPPLRGPTPTPENLSINHVLLLGYHDYHEKNLTTSVFFSANHQDNYIREYSCFIKTKNVFSAYFGNKAQALCAFGSVRAWARPDGF